MASHRVPSIVPAVAGSHCLKSDISAHTRLVWAQDLPCICWLLAGSPIAFIRNFMSLRLSAKEMVLSLNTDSLLTGTALKSTPPPSDGLPTSTPSRMRKVTYLPTSDAMSLSMSGPVLGKRPGNKLSAYRLLVR